MDEESSNPFDSIEGTYDYMRLLHEAIDEARQSVDEDLAEATLDRAPRRVEALQLVKYKLSQVDEHVRSTRRLLNDLRTLRRMLLGERSTPARERPADRVRSV